jgi:hypothetical protein
MCGFIKNEFITFVISLHKSIIFRDDLIVILWHLQESF